MKYAKEHNERWEKHHITDVSRYSSKHEMSKLQDRVNHLEEIVNTLVNIINNKLSDGGLV
jgi:hypothetical protein